MRANDVVKGLILEPDTKAALVVIVRPNGIYEFDFATQTDRSLVELGGLARLAATQIDLKTLGKA